VKIDNSHNVVVTTTDVSDNVNKLTLRISGEDGNNVGRRIGCNGCYWQQQTPLNYKITV